MLDERREGYQTISITQMVSRLEQFLLIFSASDERFSNRERVLDHMVFMADGLIGKTLDLLNGVKQDEFLEGEYKPISEFGDLLEVFVKAYKLMAKADDNKVKSELELILLNALRVIVEIVSDTATNYTVNFINKHTDIEQLKLKLEKLEKSK
jgi:hypothetical protein